MQPAWRTLVPKALECSTYSLLFSQNSPEVVPGSGNVSPPRDTKAQRGYLACVTLCSLMTEPWVELASPNNPSPIPGQWAALTPPDHEE